MKKLLIIAFTIGMGTTPIQSERPCLWIGVISAGAAVSMVAGGLLGHYFPSPALGTQSQNLTDVVGACGALFAYSCLLSAAACAKACYDGACCKD